MAFTWTIILQKINRLQRPPSLSKHLSRMILSSLPPLRRLPLFKPLVVRPIPHHLRFAPHSMFHQSQLLPLPSRLPIVADLRRRHPLHGFSDTRVHVPRRRAWHVYSRVSYCYCYCYWWQQKTCPRADPCSRARACTHTATCTFSRRARSPALMSVSRMSGSSLEGRLYDQAGAVLLPKRRDVVSLDCE